MAFPWYAAWSRKIQSFYAQRNDEQHRTLLMHNAIWIFHHGPIATGLTVDHADRQTLDNRISGLRLATRSQQTQNRGLNSNNTSGYRGVSRNHRNWQAKIGIGYKRIPLGTFPTPEEAAHAYDAAAVIYFDPAFVQLNFPT